MADLRMALVDDHHLFRDALTHVLRGMDAGITVIEAAALDDLVTTLARGGPIDLLILDLNVPGIRGLLGLTYFRSLYPEVPVLVSSDLENRTLMARCLLLGAAGFVLKSEPATEIRQAVQTVLTGGTWPRGIEQDDLPLQADAEARTALARLASLTSREIEVLWMQSRGLNGCQIAADLGIREPVVEAHLTRILEKLQVGSPAQAQLLLHRLEGTGLPGPSAGDAPESGIDVDRLAG